MLGRLILSLGPVAAAVGLTLYGMATSYSTHEEGLGDLGVYLMIGGTIATLIGIVLYRAGEKSATR